jgi:4-amino-4-deoxy-L-arabinose transferase-like glycosyltransferase
VTPSDSRTRMMNALQLVALLVICFFHLWKLADLPRGFYCDELSIGYNALLVAQSGYDEHHRFLPVFFEAFGEYKNPLYIYTAALIFKIVGVSEFALRFTSFIFFFIFLLFFYLLTARMFRNRVVSAYALLAAGFLPYFFSVSRISFEVISQLTTVAAALYFIHRTYHPEDRPRGSDPLLAGILLGLSVYSYSTARMLTFLLYLSVMVIYGKRSFLKRSLVVSAAFFAGVVPYLLFSLRHPGALTARFKTISYLYNPELSLPERAGIFLQNYLSYLRPDFLLLSGDRNLRHATGYGGEVFAVVLLLALVGFVVLALQKKLFTDRFLLLLAVNLLLAPAAGSLTGMPGSPDVPHALRSILLGLYLCFFSCCGLYWLQLLKDRINVAGVNGIVFAALLIQTLFYLHNYYTAYDTETAAWFETAGFRQALALALEQKPERVLVSSQANQPYVLLEFYRRIVDNPANVPVSLAPPVPQKNACLIYFNWNEPLPVIPPYPFRELPLPPGVVQLRCY